MTFRNRYLVLADVLLIIFSGLVSFLIRFDTWSIWDHLTRNAFLIPLLLAIRLPLFYAFGFYRRLWRYASVNEQVTIATASLLGSVGAASFVMLVLIPLGLVSSFPRSILLIEGMLTLLLVGGIRFSFRLSGASSVRHSVFNHRQGAGQRRVLIFGAGDAGAQAVREIQANPALGLEAVAFLDDDSAKTGMCIHNVPVLGRRTALEQVVRAQHVDCAIIAMPSVPGRIVREIAEQCRKINLPLKTIPGLYELLDGSVQVSKIREVQVEDLLRREPITIDLKQVGQYLMGASVLVTGAGGSIGSELCRQVARFDPRQLVLFELGENNLYEIHRELKTRFPELALIPMLGNVRERDKLDRVFSQQQPEVVFHAAAYKHVPLTESNVGEAVLNNVIGTRNMIDASLKYHVGHFVLISTDKAVNPKSVMGACKRAAELLVQDAARRNGSAFVAVRFGNVLGSSGSVVPLFEEQIAAGGPVTVTHPEVERYFMTIPEAVSLIIQAAAFGKGGEIFVLDMGEPVRIQDLARDLIRLSGFDPGQEIGIVFTGLRPGEKLREELFTQEEGPLHSKHPRILVAKADRRDGDQLRQAIGELECLAHELDEAKISSRLRALLPEYTP